VAVAAVLEAAVSLRRLAGAGLFAVAALHGAAALAATKVLIVAGLGGDPQYEERFTQWAQKMAAASLTAAGGDAQAVVNLSGEAAKREAIEARLAAMTKGLGEGDEFVLVLIGHGTYDGNEYRLNIPGPDVTGTELGTWLDRIPGAVPQLIVNTTSTSGAIADKWAKPNRVIITATRTGGERNATRFAGYWAEALTNDAADRDKDGSVTAQEAYDYATRRVGDTFKSDAALQSEHAKLTGSNASRFVVARLGAAALFASDAELMALRKQQNGIEQRLAQLKPLKAQLSKDEYYDRIEPVLLEMAKLGERIDARLATLGMKTPGGGNAKP
jgi:hypothetical protein